MKIMMIMLRKTTVAIMRTGLNIWGDGKRDNDNGHRLRWGQNQE
jgi:hypothetical protein